MVMLAAVAALKLWEFRGHFTVFSWQVVTGSARSGVAAGYFFSERHLNTILNCGIIRYLREECVITWSSNNAAGAFWSPLKLVLAGILSGDDGKISGEGVYSYYWSSTFNGTWGGFLYVYSYGAETNGPFARGHGDSVRCLKD